MEKEQTQQAAFVNYIIDNFEKDKAMGAKLRRADNPGTEYQSWQYLVRFGVNLEDNRQRRSFATIAAALAKAKPNADGHTGLGNAIALAYEKGAENEQAVARLRRLLACGSSEEACDVLRPLLQLIASRASPEKPRLSYAGLLKDLLYFNEKTKERWAQDFFKYSPDNDQPKE